MNKLPLTIGLASKRGPHERNEDAAAVSMHHDFFAIADGIGGAPLGDVASTLCCNAALRSFDEDLDIEAAFSHANEELIALKELLWTHNPGLGNLSPLATTPVSRAACSSEQVPRDYLQRSSPTFGAGCTLLLAKVDDASLELAWAGDTVALRLRDGQLETIAAPDNIGNTNELGSAVGYLADIKPLRARCAIEPGDRFLLCTDGVWGELSPDRLANALGGSDNAPWLAEVITKEAVEHGHDNATAIVIAVGNASADELAEDGSDPQDTRNAPPISRTPCYPTISYR